MSAALAVMLLAATGNAGGRMFEEEDPVPIAPPEPLSPPAPLEPPPADENTQDRSKALRVKSAIARCQRCGYIINDGWRFCPACGWDHLVLAGDEAGRRLELIQQSVVGVIVVKDKLGFEDFLSPKQMAELRRYRTISGEGGERKFFGTALPYGEDGLYVTSAALLHRGKSVQLRNFRNHFVAAEIVGYDLPSGIGVLKADVVNLEPHRPAEDRHAQDERAWVVCYPVAAGDDLVRYLPASIHGGRLVDRGYYGTQLVSFENLVRSDHTLPSGCTGGLLIDSLGMPAGVILGSPDDGITYAQPLRDVAPIIESLAKGQPIKRPYYGIALVMPDERRRARFSLPPGLSRPVVAYLIDGSPAREAGVRPGDMVTAIEGEQVADVAEAGALLLGRAPGGPPVKLTLRRDDAQIDVMVHPIARAARLLLDPADEIQEALEAILVEVKTGKANQHGLRMAQLVRGGRGEKAGYRDGDTIRKVDRESVRDLGTFNRIIRKENEDMFSPEAEGLGISARATYAVELEVRTAVGAVEQRPYINLFPEMLAPPVY